MGDIIAQWAAHREQSGAGKRDRDFLCHRTEMEQASACILAYVYLLPWDMILNNESRECDFSTVLNH